MVPGGAGGVVTANRCGVIDVLTLVALLLLPLLGCQADEAPGVITCPMSGAVVADGQGYGYASVGLPPEAPAGVAKAPDSWGKDVWYGQLRAGDGAPLTLAVVRTGLDANKRPVYTVYVDTKGGQPPAKWTAFPVEPEVRGSRKTGMSVTPTIVQSVTYRREDGSTSERPYRFRLRFLIYVSSQRSAQARPYVILEPQTCMRGRIQLGGKSLAIAVMDGGGDALFGIRPRSEGDMLWIDDNGDGKVDLGPEVWPLVKYRELNGKWYTTAMVADGTELTFTPYTGPLADATLTATDGRGRPVTPANLLLHSEDLLSYRIGAAEHYGGPPDKVSLSYNLSAGEKGPAWGFMTSEPIDIPAGKSGLVLGGPLRIEVKVDYASVSEKPSPGEVVTRVVPQTSASGWDLMVSTQALTPKGHLFTGGQSASGTTEVKLEVLDKAGTVLGQGTAEFG